MAGELAFTTTELADMQSAQDAHMMDTCTIDAYTDAGADTYGNPNPSWVAGSSLACGFEPVKQNEFMDNSKVPGLDGRLRLPIATSIDAVDRITITHRHSVDVTDETYEIISQPKRGPSGLVLELKKVTDGS